MSVNKTKANGITLHYSEQPQTVIFLKVCKYEISRSSRGRAFHNLGGATWKDLSPSVTLVLNVDDAKKSHLIWSYMRLAISKKLSSECL